MKKEAIKNALEDGVVETALEVSGKEGYIWVTKVAYGDEEATNERIKVADFQGQPTGHVTVGAAYTKNLGNYESARVNIEISLPVLASEEEVIRTYDRIQTLVSDILAEQNASLSQ